MKTSKFLCLLRLLSVSMLLMMVFNVSRTYACDRTELWLNSVTPLAGGQYALNLNFCVGAGSSGAIRGADQSTYTFGFFLSQNAAFGSGPSSIVSPQTGFVYLDTLFGDDTLIYYSEHFETANEPWACIFSGCGPIQTVCYNITLITAGLPDSLWLRGAEGGGNPLAGCSGKDMTVYPATFNLATSPLNINFTTAQPVCPGSLGSIVLSPSGGTAPYTYRWSNGNRTSSVSNLAPGTYQVTVSDATVWAKVAAFTINSPAAYTANLGTDKTVYRGYAPQSCTTLTPTMVGGQAPFSYRWSNGPTTASINACPTVTTTYTVSVTDARGCTATDVIIVNVVDVRCSGNKVLICHSGSTLCVTSSQVAAHLAHGDVLGGCANKVADPGLGTGAEAVQNLRITPFPVPASEHLTLRIEAPAAGTITAEVINLQGQRMILPRTVVLTENGFEELAIPVDQWAPGLYIARVTQADGTTASARFTVIK